VYEDNQEAETISAEAVYLYPPRKQQPTLISGHFLPTHTRLILASLNRNNSTGLIFLFLEEIKKGNAPSLQETFPDK
jgi:hypothetical protein